jgi:hypothetical protein
MARSPLLAAMPHQAIRRPSGDQLGWTASARVTSTGSPPAALTRHRLLSDLPGSARWVA